MNPIWGLQVPMLHCWTSLGSKHTTCIVHAVSPCNGTKHFLRYLSSKAIVCYEAQDFYCTSNPSTLIKRQRFNCRKARLYSYCPHPSSMHQVSVSLIGWSYSVWSLKLLFELPSWVSQRNKFKKKLWNEFWLGNKTELPTVSEMAPNTLLPLCTTYLCAAIFSELMVIRSKCWYIPKMLTFNLYVKLNNTSMSLVCKFDFIFSVNGKIMRKTNISFK